jgi:hypothetical protein
VADGAAGLAISERERVTLRPDQEYGWVAAFRSDDDGWICPGPTPRAALEALLRDSRPSRRLSAAWREAAAGLREHLESLLAYAAGDETRPLPAPAPAR